MIERLVSASSRAAIGILAMRRKVVERGPAVHLIRLINHSRLARGIDAEAVSKVDEALIWVRPGPLSGSCVGVLRLCGLVLPPNSSIRFVSRAECQVCSRNLAQYLLTMPCKLGLKSSSLLSCTTMRFVRCSSEWIFAF